MARLASPYRTITLAFLAYKAILLSIAIGSLVGPTYDTSAGLLLSQTAFSKRHGALDEVVARLTSWDAIYFTQSARRWYAVEQEWAFGLGLPTLVSGVSRACQALGVRETPYTMPLIGVLISHTSHFLSAIVLYRLGLLIWHDKSWSLTAALFHILSPAGLFLSAPYAESTFSLLSFVGYYTLADSYYRAKTAPAQRDAQWVLAGVFFGLAATFRANGLLNGLIFAWVFLEALWTWLLDPDAASFRRMAATWLGGACVGLGYTYPQYLAYREFCTGAVAGTGQELRPWCTKWVPSIYNFVQKEYWNTGLFRYWVLPNIPLFALAAPMLFVMLKGGRDILGEAMSQTSRIGRLSKRQAAPASLDQAGLATIVGFMAGTQMLIAIMTLTSYHVQIITRLSSGYPAWYWWLAACLRNDKTQKMGVGLVVFMVVYGCVQPALFASFLPPA